MKKQFKSRLFRQSVAVKKTKPLILEFAQEQQVANIDSNLIEYSDKLNLTVLKNSGKAAIKELKLDTVTVKKGEGQPSDTDKNCRHSNFKVIGHDYLKILSCCDSDGSIREIDLRDFFDTRTIMEGAEGSDSD